MKLCESCRYRNNTEYEKPCIIYRDDCEYYEKERGDMTREEAIELLKEELQTSIDNKEDFADIDGIEKYNESLAMAIKALEQEQKWIPVSERLPDSQTEVIVSCRDDSADNIYRYTVSGWITTDGEYWIVDNEINPYVIAWMPLPEPYKAESEEV